MEKIKIYPLVTVIGFVAAVITIHTCKNIIIEYILIIHEILKDYPFVSGVFFSCLFAYLSMLIILILVNNNNKDDYQEIFENYKLKLLILTMLILFYMAIHLASTAFDNITIPIFSESYNRSDFFRYFSPQDVFLSLLAFSVVLLVFFIVPNKPNLQTKNIKIPLPKLALENKHCWLCFSWVKTPINLLTTFFIIFLIVSLMIIIPSPPENTPPPEKQHEIFHTYLFNWDKIPGNDSKTFKDLLKQNYDIYWIESAEIEKIDYNRAIKVYSENCSLSLRPNDENTSVILKIDEYRTDEFIAKKIDGVYPQTIEPDKSMFNRILIVSSIILISFTYFFKYKSRDTIKEIKGDFRNLIFFYSIIPAIIVATLVLSGNNLVEYPNFAGHIVVGILFISGFYSYITLITIYFSLNKKPYLILFYLALISFVAIFLFTYLFLVLCSEDIIEDFRHTLNFIVVMIIMVLIYSSFYEKLDKYKFTEWWKEWKPIAIICSILVILIVSVIKTECNIFGYTIPKFGIIILALILLIGLPWIIGWINFRGKLPKYQGMVLVKAETSPDKLKKLKNRLSSEDGLYNTKVIMGEYDLCLIIEGLDLDDIAKKVLKIRENEGIISTTTYIDINEFFDKEVK